MTWRAADYFRPETWRGQFIHIPICCVTTVRTLVKITWFCQSYYCLDESFKASKMLNINRSLWQTYADYYDYWHLIIFNLMIFWYLLLPSWIRIRRFKYFNKIHIHISSYLNFFFFFRKSKISIWGTNLGYASISWFHDLHKNLSGYFVKISVVIAFKKVKNAYINIARKFWRKLIKVYKFILKKSSLIICWTMLLEQFFNNFL